MIISIEGSSNYLSLALLKNDLIISNETLKIKNELAQIIVPTIKYFLNKMIKKYNLAVNLSKDLVTDKSNVSFLKNYKLFKKNISLINKDNKINSIFSKRLGI